MTTKPNSNLSLTVHEARTDPSISELSLSSQMVIFYAGTSVKTKTRSENSPVWEENFNFEYTEGNFEIVLVHNPAIFKEIIIGKNIIRSDNATGWFDLKNCFGKIGTVRLTIVQQPICDLSVQELEIKFNQLCIFQDDIARSTQRYLKRLAKLKKFKKSSGANSINLAKNSYLEQNDLEKLKKNLQTQEENIYKEQESVKNSWTEIEKARQDLQALHIKFRGAKLQYKALSQSPSEKNYLQTPKSHLHTPISSNSPSQSSCLSLTQPRDYLKPTGQSIFQTPKSKLLKF